MAVARPVLHRPLRSGVEGAGRLVADEDGRLPVDGPGNGQALAPDSAIPDSRTGMS
jgi:hypothetical protein